jgi:magnesium chelatase family protein
LVSEIQIGVINNTIISKQCGILSCMLSKTTSRAVIGLKATLIDDEINIASQSLPPFTIVGLPDKVVEESKEKVRSTIKNSGADFPISGITVNLAFEDLAGTDKISSIYIAMSL